MLLVSILVILIIGALAGGLARLIVGSPTPLGCLGTAALGIIGSFVGGSLYAVLFLDRFDLRQSQTFIGAVFGSIIVLLLFRLVYRPRVR